MGSGEVVVVELPQWVVESVVSVRWWIGVGLRGGFSVDEGVPLRKICRVGMLVR